MIIILSSVLTSCDLLINVSHPNKSLIEEICLELNNARTNSRTYATSVLTPMLSKVSGENGKLYDNKSLTNEVVLVIPKCIIVMNKIKAIFVLSLEKGLCLSAQWLVNDQAAHNTIGHKGIVLDYLTLIKRMNKYGVWEIAGEENCAYGLITANEIVV